jgi:hypothetical protein
MSAGLDPERMRLAAARDGEAAWYLWGPYLAERQWGTVREDYSPHGTAWEYFPHDQARSRVYRWGEDGLLGIADDRAQLCFALALWNGADPILKERLFGLTGNEGNHGEDVKECYYFLDNTPTHSYMAALYKYPQRAFPYAELVAESRRRGRDAPEYDLLDTGAFAADRYFDVLVEYAKAAPDDILIRISVTNRGPDAALLHVLPTLWFRNTWAWGRDPRRPALRVEPDPFPPTPLPPQGDGGLPAPIAPAPPAHPFPSEGGRGVGGARGLPAPPSPAPPAPPLSPMGERGAGGLPAPPPAPPAPPFPRREGGLGGLGHSLVRADHPELGSYWLACAGAPPLLFTENETNAERLWGLRNAAPYVKDSFHAAIVHGDWGAVNPAGTGTKVAAHYRLHVPPGATETLLLRLSAQRPAAPFDDAAALFARRQAEADEFYQVFGAHGISEDERRVQRQAFAGLLWSKQFYSYDVEEWLTGDPAQPPPPPERWHGRNHDWTHLNAHDVIAMPDTWEYPWFAAWDLAFHCIPFALVDPEFAKKQLLLLGREWYQHPNGQLPAYEWAFGDVNPPVHAWAAWRTYKIEKRLTGRADRPFLERIFHKLLLNFTWWVNRKDPEGRNVFQGGFLGLDNIGVFDRSKPLPTGGHLEQSDGTAWMGMYCLNMLAIALELAREDRVYEDVAIKFFEHFMYVAGAMNNLGNKGIALWDEEDEFFYDVLHLASGEMRPLKVRSLVGLIPLLAVETVEPDLLGLLPTFRMAMEWFLTNKPDLASLVSRWYEPGAGERRLLALVRGHRMKRLLKRMLDPEEFLGDYGVRAVSRYHAHHPYELHVDGQVHAVRYEPGESTSGLFGGNSNWRGPIWFPINYLLIESLQKFHHYYGDDFLVECPTGSGQKLTLWQIADHLSQRLISLFVRGADGRRPVFGANEYVQHDAHWRDHVLFYEYFHGDSGAGVGASHQTGWTALVAKLLDQTSVQLCGLTDDAAAHAQDLVADRVMAHESLGR